MNRRVDLTQNRDFRKSSIDRNMSIPMIFMEKINSESGLILTGDKEEIQKKRWYLAMDGEVCHRCGTNLPVVPWEEKGLLCRTCNTHLEEEFDSVSKRLFQKEEIKSVILR